MNRSQYLKALKVEEWKLREASSLDAPPKKKGPRVIKNVEVFKNGFFLMGQDATGQCTFRSQDNFFTSASEPLFGDDISWSCTYPMTLADLKKFCAGDVTLKTPGKDLWGYCHLS